MDTVDLDNVFLNESDGLNNQHPIPYENEDPDQENDEREQDQNGSGDENKENNSNSDDDISDIPKSLIVTGLDAEFFLNDDLKSEFESIFNRYGECTYQYFKSFKRVRVNYDNPEASVNARLNGHLLKIGESTVNCYFCIGQQVKSSRKSADGYLHPPTPDKQFLISPPASPPVDWEPRPEGCPNINFDLIAALSQLTPGEAHELHTPISSSHPSIVVHIAAAPTNEKSSLIENLTNFKIVQTKRPPAEVASNTNATGAE